mmetsp:Transcript_61440/g.126867  ORF Transcript_61440/g.126867 Transcript_61440/m.126867 type:complete len:213 (-) Transcript_61440:278-916(-)
MKGKTPWNVRRLLDLRYNKPTCLSDLGLTSLPGDAGTSALAAAWMMANTALSSARALSGWRRRSRKWRACGDGDVSRSIASRTDAFAPVPRSVVGRILMSMAAAANLEMHCVDLSQAFIQASWADLPGLRRRPKPRCTDPDDPPNVIHSTHPRLPRNDGCKPRQDALGARCPPLQTGLPALRRTRTICTVFTAGLTATLLQTRTIDAPLQAS